MLCLFPDTAQSSGRNNRRVWNSRPLCSGHTRWVHHAVISFIFTHVNKNSCGEYNLHLSSPAAVATPSPSNIGYRPGDMALLGLIMAALLVLCLIVIGFLISRLWKGNGSMDKICEVSQNSLKMLPSNQTFEHHKCVSRNVLNCFSLCVPVLKKYFDPYNLYCK